MQEQTELVKEGTPQCPLKLNLYAEIVLINDILMEKWGKNWCTHRN